MTPHPPFDYMLSGYVYGLFTAAIAYHTGALVKQTWTAWRRRRFSVASPASSEATVEAEDMGGMENQLSFEDALEKRDDVLAETGADNKGWMKIATDAFQRLDPTWSGIGEDLRFALTEMGVPTPRHVNVWGVFVGNLVRRGLLVTTGERRPMTAKGANGRRSDVYARAVPEMAA